MSFCFDTKQELCQIQEKHKLAMFYGMILFSDKVDRAKMQITSENVFVINRLDDLASELFGVHFLVDENMNAYTAVLQDGALKTICDAMHIDFSSVQMHFNSDLLQTAKEKAAFLRGAFLAGGFITNPYSGYHLEMVTHYYRMSQDVLAFLHELGFSFKSVVRKSHYVLYLKDSTEIEQFLYLIGANQSAFALVNAKIYKQMQNYHNRLNNCEEYNRDKSMDKSIEQLLAIQNIIAKNKLGGMSEDLQAVAKLRMENQQASLAELVKLSDGKYSKAGLSRRLAKIIEFSGQISE